MGPARAKVAVLRMRSASFIVIGRIILRTCCALLVEDEKEKDGE